MLTPRASICSVLIHKEPLDYEDDYDDDDEDEEE
jgi:hypothetical protein